jgi:hypothetical protein
MALGAAFLVIIFLVVWRFYDGSHAGELERRAQRLELVSRMRSGLFAASEAEKSAVLAITDEESGAFADQARERSGDVERARQELAGLLASKGTPDERRALASFSESFAALQQIDDAILRQAEKNTNVKAYALTYGPATAAVDEMGAALAPLVDDGGSTGAASPEGVRAGRLAAGAQIAALRILTLLPPHIAEASDETMSAMEARMAEQERVVRADLDALAALPSIAGSPSLRAATAAWDRFATLEPILALSRENTNVRSLDLSLKGKRAALRASEAALTELERALDGAGVPSGRWVLPR